MAASVLVLLGREADRMRYGIAYALSSFGIGIFAVFAVAVAVGQSVTISLVAGALVGAFAGVVIFVWHTR